eukprot:c14122_g1_i1 orf=485-1975(-)
MLGASYSCGVGANDWIARWFNDCIYTALDMAGFCIGLSSVFFWLTAQLPQFIGNILRGAADALSPWFLAQWLAGDTLNFLGCMFTGNQLKTQTITAGYFIFSDIVIIIQYLYYQGRNKKAIDFDESLHKGSGYSDSLKSNGSRDSTLDDQSPHTKACKDNKVGASNCTDPGLHEGVWVSAYNNWANNYVNLSKYAARSSSDDSTSHEQSVADSTSGAVGDLGELPKQKCRAFEPSDSAASGSMQQDGWMYEQRHRLKRLVQEYGLEYGHGTAMRLTSLYNTKRKEKYNSRQARSSRRALDNASFRKSQYKAVLGIAGLFGLVSITNLKGLSSMSKDNGKLGFMLGRRDLLALNDSGATTAEISTLLEVGQSAGALIAGQLLYRASSWSTIVGQFFGWGSSALYLGSRISQLVKNKQRQSAEGLSLAMVTCAVLANVTYGSAILMRGPSWEYLIGKAPWLIGSFGTVFLDFSLFIQAHYYSWHSKKGLRNDYPPLLA